MILLVLVFASNFVFTWVIPFACACACVASENQALDSTCVFNVLMFQRFNAGEIWKRRFHSESASNLLRAHYAWKIEKATVTSRFGFVFEENSGREMTQLS